MVYNCVGTRETNSIHVDAEELYFYAVPFVRLIICGAMIGLGIVRFEHVRRGNGLRGNSMIDEGFNGGNEV